NGCFEVHLARLASRLEGSLLDRLCDSESAQAFVRTLPAVLERCDERSTYQLQFSAEAFAHIHLLERYRRAWMFRALQRAERLIAEGGGGCRGGVSPASAASRKGEAVLAREAVVTVGSSAGLRRRV